MYLLDTDHVSLIDRSAGKNLRVRLAQVPAAEVVTSIVTYEEQMRGWLAYINGQRGADKQIEGYLRLEQVLNFYCVTPMLSFNQNAMEHFQRLWLLRTRVGAMDLKIASIALAHDATVLTRNISDFGKVPGLRVEDWST
jgi:tRNA(fMet)-specific endonuclease VapC